jgi:hypothetical protein
MGKSKGHNGRGGGHHQSVKERRMGQGKSQDQRTERQKIEDKLNKIRAEIDEKGIPHKKKS